MQRVGGVEGRFPPTTLPLMCRRAGAATAVGGRQRRVQAGIASRSRPGERQAPRERRAHTARRLQRRAPLGGDRAGPEGGAGRGQAGDSPGAGCRRPTQRSEIAPRSLRPLSRRSPRGGLTHGDSPVTGCRGPTGPARARLRGLRAHRGIPAHRSALPPRSLRAHSEIPDVGACTDRRAARLQGASDGLTGGRLRPRAARFRALEVRVRARARVRFCASRVRGVRRPAW